MLSGYFLRLSQHLDISHCQHVLTTFIEQIIRSLSASVDSLGCIANSNFQALTLKN